MKVIFGLAGALFVLVSPSIAWTQSTLNFPIPVDAASGSQVGYAVVNPNPATATATFTAYDQTGTPTGSTSVSIPARGQFARLFSELFANSSVNGWVQVTSSVSGLKGFTIGGDFANNVDGTAGAEGASDQVFPLIGNTTTIALANPTAATLTLTLSFLTAAGGEIPPALSLTLFPHASLVQPLLDLPWFGQQYAGATYVRITGSCDFAATALVAQYLVAKPEFALYNGIDVSKAGTALTFPHVVDGELDGVLYRTAIALTNLSSIPQSVALTFTPDSGLGPVSISITLSPGATIRDVVTFPGGGFHNGWLQVQSPGPIAGVMAVTNTDPRSVGIAVVQPQTAGSTSMIFSHFANLAPWATGLAFVNTTSNPVTVEVFAMNPNGTLIGGPATAPMSRFTLNPQSKTARLLNELIPQTQTANGGFVFVRTSGIPIFGMELFSLRKGGPIANVPADVLTGTINFTPPAQ
jgi:hypothetical protein